MAAARLGDVRRFPFVDPPDPRAITDGVKLLEELNAVKNDRLTETGRQMARLPVDPRIARMIIESGNQGCAREILVIAAALSIQDPRERPSDNQQAADTAHRRFAQPESDFLAFVALWDYLAEKQRELSGSAFRRLCRAEFLNYLRVREWQDLHGQLSSLSKDLGINTKNSSSERQRVHTALLAGLLSQVGMKIVLTPSRPGANGRPGGPQERGRRPLPEYLGARGTKFAVFPGSGLARKPPDWLVAAELVETSRLWARTVAAIEPEGVEPVAAHLVKRSYSEPRWSRNSSAAVALEKVTLYGIPIIADRTVLLHRIDPALARELFIRHALVEGDWQTRHHFFRDNAKLISEASELEQRARRRGLVAGEDALYAFYDARVSKDAVSGRHFDTWWKKARHETPDLLTLSLDDLHSDAADGLDVGAYPEVWTSASAGFTGSGGGLSLSYAFEPGSESDGVTIDIPLKTLNQASPEEFSWQVPGLRLELVTELIRALPKNLRRELVPAPNVAREILADLDGRPGSVLSGTGISGAPAPEIPGISVMGQDVRNVLSREILRLRGVRVTPEDFDLDKLPPHLRITFRVMDGAKAVAAGKDLAALQRQLRPKVRATLSARATKLTRTGVTAWDFGALPQVFTDGEVKAYPALVDTGAAVDIRLFETAETAARAMRAGTRRLVLLAVKSPANEVAKRLTTAQKLVLSNNPHGSVPALFTDCVACAVDGLITEAGGPAWDAVSFDRIVAHVRPRLHAGTYEVVTWAGEILRGVHDARLRLDGLRSPALAPAVADIRAQLDALAGPGFLTAAGSTRLPALARYVKAAGRRLDKLGENAGRDAQQMAVVHRVQGAYADALAALPPEARTAGAAREIRWMIEELRVSLFAQTIGTPAPVSERRIMTAIGNLA
jgi:ATP-dependent helicase HrpA